MHIAIFCHNYLPHPGGLEIVVSTLARELSRRDRVTIITTAWGDSKTESTVAGITVHRLGALHISENLGVPYPVLTGPGIRRTYQLTSDADVIHANGMLYLTTLLALHAARRAGSPLIVTDHVGSVPYPLGMARLLQFIAWRTVGRFVISRADAVTAINSSVAADISRVRMPRVLEVIPNGVDIHTFHPYSEASKAVARRKLSLPRDLPLVLFVARDVPRKRLEDLLAVPRDSFRLVVCGGAHSTPADVINLGVLPHEHMQILYGAVDLFVQTAEKESTPLVVREALASGVPLVVRWNPNDRDSLPKDVVAWYESPEELAPLILRLIRDNSSRQRLSEAGRHWAEENLSWENAIVHYRTVYERTLADSRLPEKASGTHLRGS